MRYNTKQKNLSCSVGELVSWVSGKQQHSLRNSLSGQWRAEQGRLWHKKIQEQLAESHDCEISIQGTLNCGELTLELNGRIDLLQTTSSGITLREIKTISTELPEDSDFLRKRYAHHFLQTALYQVLLNTNHPEVEPTGEIQFIDITTETQQIERIAFTAAKALVSQTLETAAPWLTDLIEQTDQPPITVQRPFDEFRPGQTEWLKALQTSSEKVLFAEAPTGFGKTPLFIEAAIEKLNAGAVKRIVFLSAKTTGQETICRHLESMLKDSHTRWFLMRNQRQHPEFEAHPEAENRLQAQETLEFIQGNNPDFALQLEFAQSQEMIPTPSRSNA